MIFFFSFKFIEFEDRGVKVLCRILTTQARHGPCANKILPSAREWCIVGQRKSNTLLAERGGSGRDWPGQTPSRPLSAVYCFYAVRPLSIRPKLVSGPRSPVGGDKGCSRQLSKALSGQLRYALIPVVSTTIFKNFGVKSRRTPGGQDYDGQHACLECGCLGVRSPLDRLRKAFPNESG